MYGLFRLNELLHVCYADDLNEAVSIFQQFICLWTGRKSLSGYEVVERITEKQHPSLKDVKTSSLHQTIMKGLCDDND